MRKLSGAARATVHAPGIGILCMLVGGAFIVGSDAFVKALPHAISTGQLLGVRGVFSMVLISLLVVRAGGIEAIRVRSVAGQAIRGGLMIMSSFMFVYALRHLTLADATAIIFVAPILITALAAIFLREPVGFHRWAAVAVGFIGVLMIVRPGAGAINWAAILALGTALLSATRDVLTRKLAAGESSIAMLFYTTLATTLAGLATIPFEWTPMSGNDLLLLGATGVLTVAAHFLMIEAYRYAEAAATAPYKYFQLLTAAILGYLFWGEIPDVWTTAGALLIVAGGLYIARREILLARRAA